MPRTLYRGVVKPSSTKTIVPASAAHPPANQNNNVAPTLCVPFMTVFGVLKMPEPNFHLHQRVT